MAFAPDEVFKSDWYKALARENCSKLKELLGNDAGLLCEGWIENEEVHTWVQETFQCGWKGRTALHTAARRGDVKLMDQILEKISCNGTSTGEEGESSDPANSAPRGDDRQCSDSANCRLLKVVDGDYDLDALAMAVVNGNFAIVTALKEASLRCQSNPYKISDDGKQRPGIDQSKGVVETDEKKAAMWEKGLVLDENGAVMDESHEDWKHVLALSEETEKILHHVDESDQKAIEGSYKADCDFNFLERSVYLFHFTFSTWNIENAELKDVIGVIRNDIFSVAKKKIDLLKYLLFNLKDGQGRTALHVAVDSGPQKVDAGPVMVDKFLEGIPGDEGHLDSEYLNIADSAGRTPLYRAAAKNLYRSVESLLKDKRTDVTASVKYNANRWGGDLDLDQLSCRNGFKSDSVYITEKKLWNKGFNNKTNALGGPGPYLTPLLEASCSALHVAVIHKYDRVVEQLLKHDSSSNHSKSGSGTKELSGCCRRFTWPVVQLGESYDVQRCASTTQVAVLVGSTPILQRLLEYQVKEKKKGSISQLALNQSKEEKIVPSLHLAAAIGKPDIVKAFMDIGGRNPLIKDSSRNTALHYALSGKHVQFQPHLIDFVGCHHVFSWRWENERWVGPWLANPRPEEEKNTSKKTKDDQSQEVNLRYGQRRGAITLLLQAGLNLWDRNDKGTRARPRGDAPEDFVTWWYEQVAAETDRVQSQLNGAANAISVTAALVATASYVGPFVPPLGYDNTGALQAGILAVRIFVVCNNISFYFALAAIMFALLPSVPMPEESTFRQLLKTRTQVAIALVFLLPSIASVTLAFASCYISALPDHGLAHQGLVLGSTLVGGTFCLFVMIRFVLRLGNVLLTLPNGPTDDNSLITEFFSGGEIVAMKENLAALSVEKNEISNWIKTIKIR